MSDGRYPAHPQRASSFSSLAPPTSISQSRRQSWSATSFLENAMSLDLTSAPPSPVSPSKLQALSKRRSELLAKGSSASAVVLPELFLHVEASTSVGIEFVDCEDGQVQFFAEKEAKGWILREGTQKVGSCSTRIEALDWRTDQTDETVSRLQRSQTKSFLIEKSERSFGQNFTSRVSGRKDKTGQGWMGKCTSGDESRIRDSRMTYRFVVLEIVEASARKTLTDNDFELYSFDS